MAEIKPIRAWRYNRALSPRIGELTSPLFDVVSESQREALYGRPYNSLHLSVPRAEEGVGRLLRRWKHEKVLVQDALPAIYVYYQHFSRPGEAGQCVRKGFICHIKAYDWPERVVLRHENTMPQSVDDRAALLANTGLHVSPTHGLYTDADQGLEAFMDEAVRNPIYETEGSPGVRDVLAVIHDAEAIRRSGGLQLPPDVPDQHRDERPAYIAHPPHRAGTTRFRAVRLSRGTARILFHASH